MGRKQNPLVVEFFERGAKLGNSSNRYACTCRRCGEEFPKGRTETLMSHILKRCPNVSLEEQQLVFQRIQQTPEQRSGDKQVSVNGSLSAARLEGHDDQADLPQSELHHQSALDTLAEVSRRHLSYSAERTINDVHRDVNERALSEIFAEQALLTELRRHVDEEPSGDSVEPANSLLHISNGSSPQVQRLNGAFPTETTILDASPLVQTASAANHQLELDLASNTTSNQSDFMVDPQLGGIGKQDQLKASLTLQSSSGNKRKWSEQRESDMMSQQQPGGLNMRPDDPGSGLGPLQTSISPKKRGRFDDTRRKEVWDIRKRGACIRCRMLKKPCSGETPCSTCNAVESGRLWKGKCVRTRLVDECTLWSVKFFHSKANLDLGAVPRPFEQISLPGSIEARLFNGSDLCLSFVAKARTDTMNGVDPTLHSHPGHDASNSDRLMLSSDEEGIADKLGEYAKRIANTCIEEEPSVFVRATLQLALKLAQAQELDVHMEGQQSPGLSHSVHDELLQNVVELWILTQFLISKGQNVLQLRYDPLKMPQKEPHEANLATNGHERSGHIDESSQSWRTIQSQLLAAIESRCSKLGKMVMNKLERRLLQRQQVSRFATFLCAVILLSCVERMCGMYSRVGDAETSLPRSSNGQAGDQSQQTTSTLWMQGEQFSDLLIMLLRMRALLPKTKQNPDGTLSTAQDLSSSKNSRGQSVKDRIEEQTEAAAELIDPLALSVSDLIMKRDGDLEEQGEEAWDMRLVSKLLLPDMAA